MKNRKEILLMQEAERKRIAEELHNTTVQDMVCLSQKLELAVLYMDRDIVQSKLEVLSAKRQVKSIIEGIREIIYNLRPMIFDDIGYKAAFERLHDKLIKEGYAVSFDVDDICVEDGITAISVYHIVSEACQNVIRHSQASTISVSVKNECDKVVVRIADNGIGFESKLPDNHFGLSFISERVEMLSGNMKIISDKGTLIQIEIPVIV